MKRLFAILCAFSLASSAESFADQAFQFGIGTHMAQNGVTSAVVLSSATKAGFTSFRDEVYWSQVEGKKGVLAFPPRFAELEKAVRSLRASGGRPLIILDYGNGNYDGGGLVLSEDALIAWDKYVRFIVNHFGSDVDQYEVWNEWNTGTGSKPKEATGSASAYARLLERTYRAVKEENAAAVVIAGATAGVDMAWTKQLLAAGAMLHMDAFSAHSYTLFGSLNNPESGILRLDELQQLFQSELGGTRSLPIYVTEMGWPTNTGRYGVPEHEVANYIVRFAFLARSRPWIAGIWWYDLRDDGDDDTNKEHRFGFLRRDLTPKPAFNAVTRVSPLLKESTNIHAYRLPGGGYAVTGMRKGGEWLVAWKLETAALAGNRTIAAADADFRGFDWVERELTEPGVPSFWNKVGSKWVKWSMSPQAPILIKVD